MYKSLVQAGNAKETNEFSSEYGGPFKTNSHLTHPEMPLVVDQVGNNSKQKGDGHIAGENHI